MVALGFTPTPYYCEENVWQLCVDPQVDGDPRAAIFISNAIGQVAVAHQRAAPDPSQPVLWDYHVVLTTWRPAGWMIWDLDSTLGLPVALSVYLRASLGYPRGYAPPHQARFRVVPAPRYRQILATDRSHMRDAAGRLRAPAPPWPPIGEGTNLMRMVDMDENYEGEVVELSELPAALDRLR